MQTQFVGIACFIVVAGISSPARAVGYARSDNFTVLAPTQAMADELSSLAEQSRRDIALGLFGKELKTGSTRTQIRFEQGERQSGRFWPRNSLSRVHRITLIGQPSTEHLASTLRHEITHLVTHVGLNDSLPRWADEGLAMLQSDQEYLRALDHVLDAEYNEGDVRQLHEILRADNIDDYPQYAVSASLTRFLLSSMDVLSFLEFAQQGKKSDWDHAARLHLNMTVVALNQRWNEWRKRQVTLVSTNRSTNAISAQKDHATLEIVGSLRPSSRHNR